MMTLTGAQTRSARKLLGWSFENLARQARMCEIDIARVKAGQAPGSAVTGAIIQAKLQAAGVLFLADGAVKLREER